MRERRFCLNCGRELGDEAFCPGCGQATDTARLQLRPFLADVFIRLLRVNRGFFYTCGQLLVRPWDVIRNYIHGKRVRYTGPVQLLLVLCFLSVVLHHFTGKSDVAEVDVVPEELTAHANGAILYLKYFLDFYLSTPILQYIVIFIPALPMLRLVFRRYGARRFNSAEYLLSALYMSGAFLCFEIVSTPLDYVHTGVSTWLPQLYLAVIGVLSVYRAFLRGGNVSGWRTVRLIGLYLLAAITTYFVLLLVLAAVVAMVVLR